MAHLIFILRYLPMRCWNHIISSVTEVLFLAAGWLPTSRAELCAAELEQVSSHWDVPRFCSKSSRYIHCCDLDMRI